MPTLVESPSCLRSTLSPLGRGYGDPALRWVDGAAWRTMLTPDGPATLRLVPGEGAVAADAWGDGASWALAAVPGLVGAYDDVSGFAPSHPVVRDAWHRRPGLRLTRTGLVWESLVPAVLEQKVTGTEAHRSWRELLWRYGAPAPGPAPRGMRVVPAPEVWRRIPSWEWHRAGVDAKRSRTIVHAAAVAGRLEEAVALGSAGLQRRLLSLPGVGVWTAAEVAQRVLGDADAVSVGDLHIPVLVGWALAGRPLDDAGMLEVLEPYRPHRHRVVALLEVSGFRRPRFAPRYAPRDFRAI